MSDIDQKTLRTVAAGVVGGVVAALVADRLSDEERARDKAPASETTSPQDA